MRWRWVVVAVLVASVAFNAYLLLTGDGEVPASNRKLRKPRPASGSSAPTTKVVPPAIEQADRGALEARLAKADKELDRVLPVTVRFERGEPSLEDEARLQPMLDKFFGEHEYTLECRGGVCRIDSAKSGWQNDIQAGSELAGTFKEMAVGRSVYGRLEDPKQTAKVQALMIPISDFLTSSKFASCKSEHPATGTVWMSIQVVAHRYVVSATGLLASEAIGVCLRKAFEDLVSTRPIAPEVQDTEQAPFPVPVP